MDVLLKNLSRAFDRAAFNTDPLSYLREARATYGDVFVLAVRESLFSRYEDCPGVITVFGEANLAQVLDENCGFRMPVSAARQLGLPAELINLNRGLHSMSSYEHAAQKTALAAHAGSLSLDDKMRVTQMVREDIDGWKLGKPVKIVTHVKALMTAIAGELFFGKGEAARQIALDLSAYFQMRRSASSQFKSREDFRDQLIAQGLKVDQHLRKAIRSARKNSNEDQNSLLYKLATQSINGEHQYSEDQIVGHLNVLFISVTEPVTMSLIWILLTLSQNADTLSKLRNIAGSGDQTGFDRALRPVSMEVLRLLTPNTFMTRVAERDTTLDEIKIPANTEILICPLLIHREAAVFDQPNLFRPERWGNIKPTRYQYFPFGAGTHFCLGRSFAYSLLESVLFDIMGSRKMLALAAGQKIDWQINIMLCPDQDILFTPSESYNIHHKIHGAIEELMGCSEQSI